MLNIRHQEASETFVQTDFSEFLPKATTFRSLGKCLHHPLHPSSISILLLIIINNIMGKGKRGGKVSYPQFTTDRRDGNVKLTLFLSQRGGGSHRDDKQSGGDWFAFDAENTTNHRFEAYYKVS